MGYWHVAAKAALATAVLAGATMAAPAVAPAVTAAAVTAAPSRIYEHAHAHNDYLNNPPLAGALSHGFTSVEADVFLEGEHLVLCHELSGGTCYDDSSPKREITKRELAATYLGPLAQQVADNGGHVYPGYDGRFFLFVEIKDSAAGRPYTAYQAIEALLQRYQQDYRGAGRLFTQRVDGVRAPGAVTVVLTGGHNNDFPDGTQPSGCGSAAGSVDYAVRYGPGLRIATLDGHSCDVAATPGRAWGPEVTPVISYGWTDTDPGDGSTCWYDPAGIDGAKTSMESAHRGGFLTRVYGEPDCPHRHPGSRDPTDQPHPGDPSTPTASSERIAAWDHLYGMADAAKRCDVDYIASDHLQWLPEWEDARDWHGDTCDTGGGGAGDPVPSAPSITYTGPVTAAYHDAFSASATLTSDTSAVTGVPMRFTLGDGPSCIATTGDDGAGSCVLTPNQVPGATDLVIEFAGDAWHTPARLVVPFTVTREPTVLAYTGPAHVANGEPTRLSGSLKADDGTAVAGRTVTLALGSGTTRQSCSGTTAADGIATCTVTVTGQPLTTSATVPVEAAFAGDAYYLPSQATASVRLQYYTGRAFGLAADVPLPLVPIRYGPAPDTGSVRTATATENAPPCIAEAVVLALIRADALCARFATTLAPGTATASATAADVTLGLPGLPTLGFTGITATAIATCAAAGGSATVAVTVGGTPIRVPPVPGFTVDLGVARLVVDEQVPDPTADRGITVRAIHLTAVTGLDVVLGSATAGTHNCS
ncbi:hypothetical protein GCM10027258_24250 [Amycolatopsis stemonae]